MKIVIKVLAYELEHKENRDFESLINQFEIAFPGDTQKFVEVTGKVIDIVKEAAPKPAQP